jgi:hypothetical protein
MKRSIGFAAAALVAASLSACGDKPGPGRSPAGVVGTWVIDLPALEAERAQLSKLPADERMQREFQINMAKEMNVTGDFRADGTATWSVTLMGQTTSVTGTWTEKDGKVVVSPGETKTATGSMTTKEVVLTWKDGNLVFDGDGTRVVLRRK